MIAYVGMWDVCQGHGERGGCGHNDRYKRADSRIQHVLQSAYKDGPEIGIRGGATVFNVYLVGQLVLCPLGVFPYLTLRRSGRLPGQDAAAGGADPA